MLTVNTAKGQFFLSGTDPARAKWNQIKGDNYTVIYPREIDSLAKRYLWLLESNQKKVLLGLNINPKPLPVVLHPYTAQSNGLVVWAPKRMELYTTPSASTYAQNWETQLVLHETRHVGQVSHFTKGVYNIAQYFIGQQSTGLGVGLYASKWLLEGDAVVSETELSNSGRGREASFLEYYRASLLQGKYRNWDKWRYGSYKYYTPNHYAMGYLIGSTTRYRTGIYDYTGKLLNHIVREFYNPFSDDGFNLKFTGYNTIGNLTAGIRMMDSIWRADLKKRGNLTVLQPIKHKKENYFTNYSSTCAISNDSVFFVKISNSNPTSLVLVGSSPKFLKKNKSGEKSLRAFSSNVQGMQYSPKGRIYFTEIINSPRWELETYNNLFYYDIGKNKIKKLSNRTSYNNPVIDKDGNTVAVIEYPLKGGSNIVLLDADTGKKQLSIPAPYNAQLTECALVNNVIYSFGVTNKGMGLFKIDIASAKNAINTKAEASVWNTLWEKVINEQNSSFNSLNLTMDTLYFLSGIDGVSNVYMFKTTTNEFKKLTNTKYGVQGPSMVGNNLYVSEININGFNPKKIELGDSAADGHKVKLTDKNLSSDYKYIVADELSRQAKDALKREGMELYPNQEELIQEEAKFTDTLKAERYRKVNNLFRIHSWGPAYYNVDRILARSFDKLYDVLSWGATAYSQNTLGTAVTMLGYSYWKGYHAGHVNFKYSGLYPVFEISADINADERYSLKRVVTGNRYEWLKNSLSSPLIETKVLAYIPFNLSSHGWLRGLTPQAQWQFNNNEIFSHEKNKFQFRNQINVALQYYQMRPIATGAIFPKWGGSVVLKGGLSPIGGENFGQVGSVYAYGYIPGVAKRQGIKLSVSYQKQFMSGKAFYLDNLVAMPRGYVDDIYGKEYFKATVDYAIPIYLGDTKISRVAYLKRLQVIPYADFARMDKINMGTYGADILLDAHFFYIGLPISIGMRYGRNQNNANLPVDKNVFKLLFNFTLF